MLLSISLYDDDRSWPIAASKYVYQNLDLFRSPRDAVPAHKAGEIGRIEHHPLSTTSFPRRILSSAAQSSEPVMPTECSWPPFCLAMRSTFSWSRQCEFGTVLHPAAIDGAYNTAPVWCFGLGTKLP